MRLAYRVNILFRVIGLKMEEKWPRNVLVRKLEEYFI